MEHRRLVNWWIGWEDLNWPNADAQERIKRRAAALAEASVSTAVLFGAHFRWDYLPYFTILHDHIAAVAEELHKYNIELFDRHSINLVHRYETVEEMRHVMQHSQPHLPFSPSREAAASWEYHGSKLNDWRMLDVRTGEPLYYPQYASDGFCYRNPDFVDAYLDYVKRLIADTGIDGLASEDTVHYMHYLSCGCKHCRAELRRRAGIDLPPSSDRTFWGNWDNEAWRAWIDLRFDASKEFFTKLRAVLPPDFPLTTCGSNSASFACNGKASDARTFLSGCNYVHLEIPGNTPPYPHDPVTVNKPITDSIVAASHHQAVAREKDVRCFSTGYGFTEPSANIIWALNKAMDIDCLFSTLKARLGLPQHILETLPNEEVIGKAFTFEKTHPELFAGSQIGQLGVYFSYETRNHTCFGNLAKGYYADYSETLALLLRNGVSAHTVFAFPESAETYPAIIVPSAARMTEDEIAALRRYAANGGTALVTGPTALAECKNSWALPSQPTLDVPEDFFGTIANGVWFRQPQWISQTTLAPSTDPAEWQEAAKGVFYHPHRVSDGLVGESLLSKVTPLLRPLPVQVLHSEGYIVTMFRGENKIFVHFLAEHYDVDIDHKLDEMRTHRSRVNYVNRVAPIGVGKTVDVKATNAPQIFTPFNNEAVAVAKSDAGFTLTLPNDCAYFIAEFEV